jgi:tetratricopeptide (TPR) repeat protein
VSVLDRFEDAAQDCTWALDIEPDNFKALLRRGAARLEMAEEGALDLAVADIEAALRQEPENKELQSLHAKALRMVRQYIDKHDSGRMNRVMIQEVEESDEEAEESDEEAEVGQQLDAQVVGTVAADADLVSLSTSAQAADEREEDGDNRNGVEARAEAHKREGNALFLKGEYVQAERCYSAALELLPAAVALLSNRAKCRLKLKKWADAEDDADLALALEPTYVKALASRGSARAALGHKRAALEDLAKVLAAAPNAETVRAEMSSLRSELEAQVYIPARPADQAMIMELDSDEEQTEQENAGGRAPCDYLERERRFKAAAKVATQKQRQTLAYAATENRKVSEAAVQGSAARRAGKETTAEPLAKMKKAAAAADPVPMVHDALARAEALKEKGNALFRKGDVSAAITQYDASLAMATTSAVLVNRAAAQLKLSAWTAAEADATAALAMEPAHVKALHRRSQARVALGKYADAMDDLKLVAAQLPRNAAVQSELLALQAKMAAASKPARRVMIEEAEPGQKDEEAEAYRIRMEGNGKFSKGEWAAAVGCYTRSLQRRATAAAHANRAAALLKMSNAEDAEADATAALALEPDHYRALHRRAQARRALGRGAEAAADLEAVLTALPGNKQARDELMAVQAELREEKATVKTKSPPRTRIAIVEVSSDGEETMASPAVSVVKMPPACAHIAIMQASGTDNDEAAVAAAAAAPSPTRVRVLVEDISGSESEEEEEETAVIPATGDSVARQAEQLKEEGNQAFEAADECIL